MKREINIRTFVIAAIGSIFCSFGCMAGSSFIAQDVNSWLTSSYRCDLVGPEVWTGPQEDKRAFGNFDYWNENIPFRALGVPSPGLSGQLHVVHQVTNSFDAVCIEVEEESCSKVEFIPVRHRWTPAFSSTFYRSMPTKASEAEIRGIGRIVLKETKAILCDNTFLAEATIKNASATTLVCRVAIKTNSGLPEAGSPAREWHFATRSMEKVRARTAFACCKASFEGSARTFEIPPRGEVKFRYALSFSPDSSSDAARRAQLAIQDEDAFSSNAQAFNEWFAKNVPTLETGDPDLMRMYLYRWFIVKRGTHEARRIIPDHEYPRAAVYESPVGGWYNCVIGRPEDGARCNSAWDYLHSSWIDPFFRYYSGIQVLEGGKSIRFEPFAVKSFRLSNVPLLGREFDFEQKIKEDGERILTVRDAAGKVIASGKSPLTFSFGGVGCAAPASVNSPAAASRTQALRSKLASADRSYVFVAMHRGDWRNFPENSEGAILSSIRLGADIVELDVQRTKDGRFVLNHDNTLNRMTTGKGKVSDHTLAEIKKLKLRDGKGRPTGYDILTLEEALALTRGKILVNIDKFTRHPREILEAVDAAGALGEVLVKASLPYDKAKLLFGPYWERVERGEILYMPVIDIPRSGNPLKDGNLSAYLAAEPRKFSMYELCFDSPARVPETVAALKAAPGAPRLWVNTLWDSISAKHSDKAALLDPDANWGWWLDMGATMIQSDYVAELIVYLTSKGRRNF